MTAFLGAASPTSPCPGRSPTSRAPVTPRLELSSTNFVISSTALIQAGLELCSDFQGGCVTFTSGAWAESHTTQVARDRHCSWASPAGVILLGGHYGANTSELLATDSGETTMHFPLKYGVE